jgi:hypothetical protein
MSYIGGGLTLSFSKKRELEVERERKFMAYQYCVCPWQAGRYPNPQEPPPYQHEYKMSQGKPEYTTTLSSIPPTTAGSSNH